MYHYLKWAALSLFLRRNFRYLVFMVASLAGIYISDTLYEDISHYLLMTDQGDKILPYLLMKWAAVIVFSIITVWSVMKLGFDKSSQKGVEKKKRPESAATDDIYMQRLEKFKTKKDLRSKSDLLMESYKKEKKPL